MEKNIMIVEKEISHKVRHTLATPVFVIGHARSGTSMMTRLLRKYFHVNFGSESQFFMRLHRKLKRYGDLNRTENFRALIEDISKERCFKKWQKKYGFIVDKTDVLNETKERSYEAIIGTVFRQFASYQGMPRWGDKTPDYLNHLPTLLKLFPDAQFIHIVRDGRDVALSNFRAPFGAKNCIVAAEEWNSQMRLVCKFFSQLPEGQIIEIKYEELLDNPQRTMLKLLNFLKIDDRDGSVFDYVVEHIHDDLLMRNVDKWKSQMTYRERVCYERVATEMLQHYGYETWLKKSDKPKLPARLVWTMDNYIKKRNNLYYWKDHLYKIHIRVRLYLSPIKRLFT